MRAVGGRSDTETAAAVLLGVLFRGRGGVAGGMVSCGTGARTEGWMLVLKIDARRAIFIVVSISA